MTLFLQMRRECIALLLVLVGGCSAQQNSEGVVAVVHPHTAHTKPARLVKRDLPDHGLRLRLNRVDIEADKGMELSVSGTLRNDSDREIHIQYGVLLASLGENLRIWPVGVPKVYCLVIHPACRIEPIDRIVAVGAGEELQVSARFPLRIDSGTDSLPVHCLMEAFTNDFDTCQKREILKLPSGAYGVTTSAEVWVLSGYEEKLPHFLRLPERSERITSMNVLWLIWDRPLSVRETTAGMASELQAESDP